MPRKPDVTTTPPPLPLRLLHCLLADDLDQAIALGLMDYRPKPADATLDPDHPELVQHLLQAQTRLRVAWAARERHRARTARLARQAAARQARRVPAAPPEPTAAPTLPPLAAAILARAKAKAAAKGSS